VYLPEDGIKWYRFSDDREYAGGRSHIVPSPVDDAPVFVKEGAIITTQSVIQHTKEKGDGVLTIHVWQGRKETSFTYYEDDGNTYDYEKGKFLTRIIKYDPVGFRLILEKETGDFTSRFTQIKVLFHTEGNLINKFAAYSKNEVIINLR
jgi:alpha-glucosidase